MNDANDLIITLFFDPAFQEEAIMKEELSLIQSVLPELLKDIMIQAEIDKE